MFIIWQGLIKAGRFWLKLFAEVLGAAVKFGQL